jgi:hypothetical protein
MATTGSCGTPVIDQWCDKYLEQIAAEPLAM